MKGLVAFSHRPDSGHTVPDTASRPLQRVFDFFGGRARQQEKIANPVPGTASAAPLPAYEVLRSPRRRTLSLEVHRDSRVLVRVPQRCSEEAVLRFVAGHGDWIRRQVARLEDLASSRPLPRFAEGEQHLYQGRALTLRILRTGRPRVEMRGEELHVQGGQLRDGAAVAAAVSRWYLQQARQHFPVWLDRCHAHPRFAACPLPALRIRTMRSRWGTLCRQRGMTLNTVLIQAPEACLEYVVFHELCHLLHHGHGPRFHQLMSTVLPDWPSRKTLLEQTLTW